MASLPHRCTAPRNAGVTTCRLHAFTASRRHIASHHLEAARHHDAPTTGAPASQRYGDLASRLPRLTASSADEHRLRAGPGRLHTQRVTLTGPAPLTGQRRCRWGPGRCGARWAQPARRFWREPVDGPGPEGLAHGGRCAPGAGHSVPTPALRPAAEGRRTRRREARDIRCTCTLWSTLHARGSVDACLRCRQILDDSVAYRGECCGG